MIKHKHTNTYKYKLRAKKVKYITAAVLYTNTHDVRVTFRIPDFVAENLLNIVSTYRTCGVMKGSAMK